MPEPSWDEVEQLYPIKSPKSLGERVSADTLRRWTDTNSKRGGLYSYRTGRRVYLETVYRGQMLFTSKERLLAFYRRLNGIKV